MTSYKVSQCYAVSVLSLISLSLIAAPTFNTAHAAPVDRHPAQESTIEQVKSYWNGLEERHSFNELSNQNLQALNAILDADTLIAQHNLKDAKTKLSFAEQELKIALQTHQNLVQSVSYIEGITRTNPALAGSTYYSKANWAPVGGKFIALSKLSSNEIKSVTQANNDLRAGKIDLAYKTISDFQKKVQISIAIAPLEPTIKTVETALKTLHEQDIPSTRALIRTALDHYIFIPQKVFSTTILAQNVYKQDELVARR